MTAQTTTQRTAKHRLAVKERMAALEASLVWAIAEIEGRTSYADGQGMGKCLQKAIEVLEGSKGVRNSSNPTQRG